VDVGRLDALPPDHLAAAAGLWKRERREIVAGFGGVSMLPTIAPGTPLRIRCGENAVPDDVTLFLHRGQVVVHRLLAVRGPWMLTRGDANAIPDLPLALDAVIGRVTGQESAAGWEGLPQWSESAAQRRARTFATFMLAIGAPVARLAILLLWQLHRLGEALRRRGLLGIAARLWRRRGPPSGGPSETSGS
jgi:hypothetical protein